MKTSRASWILIAALLAACTNQKEPAENAVARAEATLNEVREDAGQYAAEQFQAAEMSVNRLKGYLASQDYDAVIAASPAVSAEVESLKTTVAEAKADAEANLAAAQQEWSELSASLPPMVEKLQARVDQLSRSRRYPKGMDKAAFEAAKSGFETLKTEWHEAGEQFNSGQPGDAVRKARNAKAKAEELINQLEVQV